MTSTTRRETDGLLVVEVSNEVCNKVGGIYGVLASKAAVMQARFPNYLAIGLYNHATSPPDLEEQRPPVELEAIFNRFATEGIRAYYGQWKGGRCVPCILLDAHEYMNRTAADESYNRLVLGVESTDQNRMDTMVHLIKRRNWELFQIDSYTSDYFYDEAITWSEMAGRLIELLMGTALYRDKQAVVIAHEWLSAGVIFRKKVFNLPYRTIFVTHATTHGRVDSARGESVVMKIRAEAREHSQETTVSAYERGVQATHFTEVAAAEISDLFATVSHSVAYEAAYYLGKAPDIVLTNGIQLPEGRDFNDIRKVHAVHKKTIHEFMRVMLSPHYTIGKQESLIVMTSGRYEFVNKGFDLFISAMAKLNEALRDRADTKQVYAFMLVPTRTTGLNEAVLRTKMQYRRIRSMLEPVSDYLAELLTQAVSQNERRILDTSLAKLIKENITMAAILNDAFEIPEIRARSEYPPLATHDYAYDKDPILDLCWQLGLRNRAEDRVKMIIVPSYLSASQLPLYLNYFDFVNGCDIGVFPSRYEPFGLTPIEAAAQGCVAVTSDFSGLGEELKSMGRGDEKDGIYVLPMKDKRADEIAEQLKDYLLMAWDLEYDELIALKRRAYQLAESFSWSNKIENYVDAVENVAYGQIKLDQLEGLISHGTL
ncbi:MAG: glycosyltransferase [Methanomicrobia archaeon]|nr:glycosyltransferase [Methanomicrobia archaeon]